MKTKLTVLLASTVMIAAAPFAQAADRNAAIASCETAIHEKAGTEDVWKKVKSIKDKRNNVVLKYVVKFSGAGGEEVRHIAECLSTSDGEVLELTFR